MTKIITGQNALSSKKQPQKPHNVIRKAQFANNWYPGTFNKLQEVLKSYVHEPTHEEQALAIIAPHAGYIYSGPVAGVVYSHVHIPDTVVVLCVNHRGIGAPAAILSSGFWETPLGSVQICENFARELKNEVPFIVDDYRAHSREHSLEMQVPFLQYRNKDFQLVPICLQQLSYSECEKLGVGLAQTIKNYPGKVLLVASTDMTHFESQNSAKKQDMMAIEKILAIDPKGLYETVHKNRISMCGVIPTTSVLYACKALAGTEGTLLKYATSGDVSGDYSNVVGYASIFLR